MSLTITEAADRTGLTPHTLRYYERTGLLLTSIGRSVSGQREYSERDIEWLILVTRLRATGMSIRDVRHFADLVRAGDGTANTRLDLLLEHRAKVLADLARSHEHLSAIDTKIGVYAQRTGRHIDPVDAGLTSSALEDVDFAI